MNPTPLILCLDCGNTRIKWGLHQEGQWLAQGAVTTASPLSLGDVPELRSAHPDRIIVCNVAGSEVEAIVASLFKQTVTWNVACPDQGGVHNDYEVPDRLGADRWAALIGARALHSGPCLVVTAGTATTIDLLDAAGHFRGGLILPGLDLMHAALSGNTAQLPLAQGEYREVPRNTADAIASGALHATLGAVERMYATLAALSTAQPLCLLSGGAAHRLQAHLTLPARAEPLLILEGLARVAAHAASDTP